MTYKVYRHITPSGKSYIGMTCQDVDKRWKKGFGYDTQPAFHRAIQKYGWDNIEHEILAEGLSKEEACEMEIKLIAEFKSNDPEFGYNLTTGGDGANGLVIPEDLRKKLSDSAKGNKWKAGKPISEETRRKLSESHKGKPGYWTGKKRYPETIRKMSESRKGVRRTEEHIESARVGTRKVIGRSVVQYTKTGEFVKIWECMIDASKDLNISYSGINACCHGKRLSAGGYIWKYKGRESNVLNCENRM